MKEPSARTSDLEGLYAITSFVCISGALITLTCDSRERALTGTEAAFVHLHFLSEVSGVMPNLT